MFNRKISHGKMLLEFEDYFLDFFLHSGFTEQMSNRKILQKGIIYILILHEYNINIETEHCYRELGHKTNFWSFYFQVDQWCRQEREHFIQL